MIARPIMANSPIALQPLNHPTPSPGSQNPGMVSHTPLAPSPSTVPASTQSRSQSQTTLPTSPSTAHLFPSAAQSTSTSPNPAPTSSPNPPQGRWITTWKSTILHPLKYSIKFVLAFLIYILTLYTAFTATSRHTILGNLNPSLGTWFLQILAKSGDIAFAFAVEDAFDTLTWRRLREEKRISGAAFGGIRLDWFLSLVSSTGVEGLVRLLTKAIKSSVQRRRTPPGVEPPQVHGGGWWAFLRLIFILGLIPGPGIILMANINQKQIFFPNTPHDISAGLAGYDPSVSRAYSTVWGPEIGKLVQTMLRDRSVTYPLPAINPQCKRSKTCTSFLIAGPYQTISPWPFTVGPGNEEELDSYMVFDAPWYQVDMWDIEESEGWTVSMSRDCTLYGGFNGTSDYSLLLCIKEDPTGDGVIGAGQFSPISLTFSPPCHTVEYLHLTRADLGWKSCSLGYSPSGECLLPVTAENKTGWATRMQFHHRTASLTFSRTDLTIRSVTHLSRPTPVTNLTASSLFASLNQILYRPLQITTDPRFDLKSQQYVLTQVIGVQLWTSLLSTVKGVPFAREWLRNLLVMPMYLFQPTVLAFSNQLIGLSESERMLSINRFHS
ncbi:hypothetical protein P154DRAFT_112626 [Amniculicola lignicola CBS 123094]|uniref:Uncharacterized protein n=1 Tax=Amniculicola lignicola CBS 123094 TaxID=1392246 RepID=A0A6A5X023_9PLEO|nr:hypothetical protein P154DRAFT_112626 [Amniculicola lignicola CBS 123094]